MHSYGASADAYPTPYMNAAGAIGMETAEVDVFVRRLQASAPHRTAPHRTAPRCRRDITLAEVIMLALFLGYFGDAIQKRSCDRTGMAPCGAVLNVRLSGCGRR